MRAESSDQSLLARLRAHDTAAFEDVFRAYYAELVRFANQYVEGRDDAEELVAAMFAYLYDTLGRWEVRTTIRAYLFGSVRYRVFNHLRTTRRERRRHDLLFVDEQESVIPSPSVNPEELMMAEEDQRQRLHAVARAIAHLPPRARLVLSLRWTNQMSFDEIADVLDISPAAVQMQLSRAMRALREIAPEYLR